MTSKVIRNGKGYHWREEAGAPGGTRTVSGYTIDNLDTKTIEQASNHYEKVFITVREVLKHNEQYCCNDENDRLSIAQVVADTLRQGHLIRKAGK